jgi:3-deoxy-D-manno-octulosonic-acid transferase
MGEMALYYAAADVALVGGSLQPLGGHNLIEAAACGCPVVVGPHTFNFAQATADAVAAGAALQVADAEAVVAALAQIGADPARQAAMRAAARDFAATHRGATARTVQLIDAVLEGAADASAAATPSPMLSAPATR